MLHFGAFVLGSTLLLAGPALAACVSVGSQLDCRWPGVAMRLGTQTDPEAQDAGPGVRMLGFAGPARVGRPLPSRGTMVVTMQNFTDDRRACTRLGNETYCH